MAVYVAFKMVPLYVAEYQLKDKMDEQARFAVVNRYSEDQIRDVIFKVVQDLDIPAKREDIKVEQHQPRPDASAWTIQFPSICWSTRPTLTFAPSSEGD